MQNEIKSLHEKALEIARKFHHFEMELLNILQKCDERKVFLHMGYSSLFDYAIKALKLSEANASNFITVARKSKTIPELKTAIEQGELTVSKARKIISVLTPENSAHWIELAKTLPKPKLEKEVARVSPQTLTPERAKYVSESRLEMKFGISEQGMAQLKRAQDLVSQKTKSAASFEDTLNELLEFYLERKDPVERAKRNTEKSDAAASVPGTHKESACVKNQRINFKSNRTFQREHIPASLRHQINLRDNSQCSHINSEGRRCESKRWLEVHHKIPVSKGGVNNFENLETLCFSHHKYKHQAQSMTYEKSASLGL